MNTLKRIAMTAGGIVMLAALLAVAMPKTTHAVVSTLVTIANTSANPVPVHPVDSPAPQPFATSSVCTVSLSSICAVEMVVPGDPGTMLVIQDISGICSYTGPGPVAPPPPNFVEILGNPGQLNLSAVFQSAPNLGGDTINSNYAFGRPVTFYAPAGSTITFQVGISSVNISGFCSANLNGYFSKTGSPSL